MTDEQKSEQQPEQQETVTEEDSDLVTDTNAGDDAIQGTVADQDPEGKAPEREKD